MAFTTLLAHAALMGFLGFMAGEAGGIGLLKFGIQMTGFAGSDTVYADQGKTGDIMLEKELYIPSLFIVAITAILSQFILVYIDRPMTGNALSPFKIVHCRSAMTSTAD